VRTRTRKREKRKKAILHFLEAAVHLLHPDIHRILSGTHRLTHPEKSLCHHLHCTFKVARSSTATLISQRAQGVLENRSTKSRRKRRKTCSLLYLKRISKAVNGLRSINRLCLIFPSYPKVLHILAQRRRPTYMRHMVCFRMVPSRFIPSQDPTRYLILLRPLVQVPLTPAPVYLVPTKRLRARLG
jgi:hypothetical protein